MQLENRILKDSRMWQFSMVLGAFIFLSLAIFGSFLLWTNSQKDLGKQQLIREIQDISENGLYFANEVIAGNATALAPFDNSYSAINSRLIELQDLDLFSQERLGDDVERLNTAWNDLKLNVEETQYVQVAVNLLDNAAFLFTTATGEMARFTTTEMLNALSGPRVTAEQTEVLQRQAEQLSSMTSSLNKFINERTPSRTNINEFWQTLKAYEADYDLLLNGGDNFRALSNNSVRSELEKIRFNLGLVGTTEEASRPFLNAIEKLVTVREAGQNITASFASMDETLDGMFLKIDAFSEERFPRLSHIVIAALLMMTCTFGLFQLQRLIAEKELEKEHEEGQRAQAAILRLLDELVDLADGDLTITATVTEDFTGAIADSINFTIDQLRQLVSRINSTAVQVSQAAQGTQQTALHLAEASDHQAQEIAGASAAINEMAVTIDQVSANASESALVAGKSVSIANNGAKLVQNTINGMDTIREQIQDTSKRIKRLGESSQEIGDIVSLINDIADQTNILALNAAIQASMAGDAGRGFAVVADEVQRLAERSAAATKQIETLVKTIQTDTNEAVISMEQTTSEVVKGARLAQDAGVALEEIETVSANIAELIQNISNAARQQASSAGHISNTMNVIQEITTQTSSGTSATARSIGDLAHMALSLRESVAGFTLPSDMIEELETEEDVPVLTGGVDEDESVEELLDELELDDDDAKTLADADDDDDLFSEFDVDLSDIEFSEDEQKMVR